MPVTQTWFYDNNTYEPFSNLISKLNNLYKTNNFNTDLDKFISDNYNSIFTPEELEHWNNRFYLTAYLMQITKDDRLAQMFYSLKDNYNFLTNILRKSIYEYYILQRWQIKNISNTANMFQRKELQKSEFELIQLDMIINTIETKWVKQDA